MPLLGLSFAVPALFYGLTVARSPWLEGLSLSIVASAVAGVMSYFDPFFRGGSPFANASAALYYAVLPGLVGMLAGFSLQPHVATVLVPNPSVKGTGLRPAPYVER